MSKFQVVIYAVAEVATGARWLLNVRVDAAPAVLRAIVEAALRETAGAEAVPVSEAIESFQPAPPRPTHRIALV